MNDAIGFVAGGETEQQKVIRYRESAQTSYRQSKDSAMETVGQLYLLWRTLVSPLATDLGKQTYQEEVSVLNDAIAKHNDGVGKILAKVKSFEEKKFDPTLEFSTEDKSEEDAHAIKQVEKQFYEYLKVPAAERYYLKQVKLNIFVADFEYTSLVRYGLGLYDALYNDVVSRYAKVLKVVAKTMAIDLVTESAQVVDFLRDKGGFEAVLKRAQDEDDADKEQAVRDRIIDQDANNFAREAVKDMPVKSVIQMETRFAKEGYVLMVARAHSGVAEILGEVPMTENEVKKAVLHLGNEEQTPDNDNSEFFARIMQLSTLLKEGQSAGITKDGTQSGDVYKPEKTMVIRKADDGQPHIVISNRYGLSSAVIYARPKSWEDFDTLEDEVILPKKHFDRLQKDLATLAKRRRIDYSFTKRPLDKDGKPADSPISLEVRYHALIDAAIRDPIQQFYWSELPPLRNKPLDVDYFRPQFAIELDEVDVVQILNGPYQGWDHAKAGNKAKSTTSLIFEDGNLTVRVSGKDDHIVKLSQPVAGSVTMTFNQKDIYDLLVLLDAQQTAKFQIQGDEGGLLAVRWEDKLGEYTVNLPTVTKSGDLETRRVATMRLNAMPKAAE